MMQAKQDAAAIGYPMNYKDALNELEEEQRITSAKPLSKRPMRNGKRTFGDDILVTFPKKKK